jgi:ketosteroid isomerase-like protein
LITGPSTVTAKVDRASLGQAAKTAVRDTGQVMPEESATPDLVELVRRSVQDGSDRDLDVALTLYAPDAVWDMSPFGMGTFEGIEAIRGFMEDWLAAYEEYAMEVQEIVDVGNGVSFAVILQRGRLVGSSGEVQLTYASTGVWVNGVMTRVTNYGDIDEARAAAKRLAKERAGA